MSAVVYPSIIDGKDTHHPAEKIPVSSHTNPDDILHFFSQLQVNDSNISTLANNAKEGFKEWSALSFQEKAKIFRKAMDLIKERKNEFVDSHLEIGGPGWFAGFNVDGALGQIEEYAAQLSRPSGQVVQAAHVDLAMTIKTPIGPVLSVSPWNAPVILGTRSIVAPLAAGCSVIFKTSEKSPRPSYLLVKCFLEAGVPPKALQLVHVAPQDNPKFFEGIFASGAIKKVNFTGSTFVGKIIAQQCAKYLIPYLLELGGKNVSIVLDDANLDKAAEKILFAAWAHKGQICMSTDKVFVAESIYEKFSTALKNVAAEFVKDKDHEISQRDPVGRDKVIELVKDALAKGAHLLVGDFNEAEISKTNIIPPMILENVTADMKINTVETFGPVFTLHKYKDINNVIDEVNNHDFGLKAAVWSENTMKALNVAKKMEIGGVHINASTIHDDPVVPHGGVKSSGCGRFNSQWGMDEFMIIKTITINE
ncbi:hypothetical protein KGF56_003317 [Candida oxycetoniae]|uniref:Aldehyde dehydrogenase domain-containing protein n=1 Tax=Candida oxycetoniae TaxID=497107 RepID=A0AAI9SVT8_9ASCO|nr:uncharacterized protein KGF56_003317 [Candida oxycetoniae]KAI3403887.1 hypothetical protein KGF56_003317 [Candida oxycetoniae]